MATKLKLLYPATPFITTQSWGIYNPAYLQFGFSKHNGVDFRLGKDKKLYAPVRMRLVDKGYVEKGAGYYIRFKTTEKWLVEGQECYVSLMFMHLDHLPDYQIGTIKEAGEFIGVPDNTGFSTGPHTHLSTYRLGDNDERLDTDKETNYTFDPSTYFDVSDFNEISNTIAVLVKHYDQESNPLIKIALWVIIQMWIKRLADLANKV